MNKLWQTASIVAVTLGFACLFFSFFLPQNSMTFTISLALGVALLPAGIISIITAISSSRILQEGLRAELGRATKDLHASIRGLRVASGYLNASDSLGVAMVYPNRNEALKPFEPPRVSRSCLAARSPGPDDGWASIMARCARGLRCRVCFAT